MISYLDLSQLFIDAISIAQPETPIPQTHIIFYHGYEHNFRLIYCFLFGHFNKLINFTEQFYYHLYERDSSLIRQPYKLNQLKDVIVHPDFDASKQTLLYLNDCFESFDESVEVIVNAYLKRRDHNILVLEWTSFNNADYFEVLIPNIKRVSILRLTAVRVQLHI